MPPMLPSRGWARSNASVKRCFLPSKTPTNSCLNSCVCAQDACTSVRRGMALGAVNPLHPDANIDF